MALDYLRDEDVRILRAHLRQRQSHAMRPLFVFPCGGNEREFASRRSLREFVSRSPEAALENVFCLTAEDIASSGVLGGANLLQQEAMLADICDWIVVFAESAGSLCELGAFAVLPHAAAVTTLVIDRRHLGERSFLADGPAREIGEGGQPLNGVFYLDLANPLGDRVFSSFVRDLREGVRRGLRRSLLASRKAFNRDEDDVRVGPLVHELLDLLQFAGPMPARDLFDLYCDVKRFRRRYARRVYSTTLLEDMRLFESARVPFESVVGMMLATGLVSRDGVAEKSVPPSQPPTTAPTAPIGPAAPSPTTPAPPGASFSDETPLRSNVRLDSYFMFRGSREPDFANARARVLLRRRAAQDKEARSVYRKPDGR